MSAGAVGAWLDPVLSLLYPPCCFVCRQLGECGGLCDVCVRAIVPVPTPFCDRCGHPVGEASGCDHCRRRAPAFHCSRSLGTYEGVLRDAVHRFKYHDRPKLAEPLGVLLAAFARKNAVALNDLQFDALVPVPMHPVRQRLRGYNQSERLARIVGRELSLPVETSWLTRPRSTRPQVGLDAEARRQNLAGAFFVSHPTAVVGKTLLLIDDVMTTGSTLHECATILSAAGATVYALTLAAG